MRFGPTRSSYERHHRESRPAPKAGCSGGPLYAIETNDWTGELGYVTTLDAQEEVRLDGALEFRAYSTVRKSGDRLFMCTSPTVTRYASTRTERSPKTARSAWLNRARRIAATVPSSPRAPQPSAAAVVSPSEPRSTTRFKKSQCEVISTKAQRPGRIFALKLTSDFN